MSRQTDRRALRRRAMNQMPTVETWTTDEPTGVYEAEDSQGGFPDSVPIMKTVSHFALVPRSRRRAMARVLGNRQWRVDHGRPESGQPVRRGGVRK